MSFGILCLSKDWLISSRLLNWGPGVVQTLGFPKDQNNKSVVSSGEERRGEAA